MVRSPTLVSLAMVLMTLLMTPPALAGPPFLTDDPEPTETGHWEIYAPLVEAEGAGPAFEGSAGVEINYGAAPDIQLTLGLPLAYVHAADETDWSAGDLAVSLKYRFYQNEALGLSLAFFPGVTLPTASDNMGAGYVTAFLPVWFQKDAGSWSVFGGGGYAINPGKGNQDYWTGALAISSQVTPSLTLGLEVQRQGADTDDGKARTDLGIAAIWKLNKPLRLLASAGPTFTDESKTTGFHAFIALGLNF